MSKVTNNVPVVIRRTAVAQDGSCLKLTPVVNYAVIGMSSFMQKMLDLASKTPSYSLLYNSLNPEDVDIVPHTSEFVMVVYHEPESVYCRMFDFYLVHCLHETAAPDFKISEQFSEDGERVTFKISRAVNNVESVSIATVSCDLPKPAKQPAQKQPVKGQTTQSTPAQNVNGKTKPTTKAANTNASPSGTATGQKSTAQTTAKGGKVVKKPVVVEEDDEEPAEPVDAYDVDDDDVVSSSDPEETEESDEEAEEEDEEEPEPAPTPAPTKKVPNSAPKKGLVVRPPPIGKNSQARKK